MLYYLVQYFAGITKLTDKVKMKCGKDDAFSKMGLQDMGHKKNLTLLSQGQQQRVALARPRLT